MFAFKVFCWIKFLWLIEVAQLIVFILWWSLSPLVFFLFSFFEFINAFELKCINLRISTMTSENILKICYFCTFPLFIKCLSIGFECLNVTCFAQKAFHYTSSNLYIARRHLNIRRSLFDKKKQKNNNSIFYIHCGDDRLLLILLPIPHSVSVLAYICTADDNDYAPGVWLKQRKVKKKVPR